MRNQYIEKDGLLFARCEPQKLRLNSPTPCIVQRSDSKDYIVVTEHNIREIYKASHECIGYVSFQCSDPSLSEEVNIYASHEIIAKHCLEGSAEWAMWQMLNGKKVRNPAYEGETYSCGGKPYSCALFITKNAKDGWYIYEDDAPEPRPTTKPEVGKWYKHEDYNEYLLCEYVFSDYASLRMCGKSEHAILSEKYYDGLIPVSLEPDFSNAKVGDKVYNVAQGYTEIDCIESDEVNNMVIVMVIKYSSCANDNEECYKDGRREYDAHPTYFYSAAQCAAYFAEVALKEVNNNE